MTPARFRLLGEELGLTQADLAVALGYRIQTRQGLARQVNDMGTGRKAIPPPVARLAEMFRRFGIPPDFLRPSSEASPSTLVKAPC